MLPPRRTAPRPNRNTRPRARVVAALVGASAAVLGALVATGLLRPGTRAEVPVPPGADSAVADSQPVAEFRRVTGTLHRDEPFSRLLTRLGVPAELVDRARAALEQTDFDFRHLQPGDSITLRYRDTALAGISYVIDPATSYIIEFGPDSAVAALTVRPVDTVLTVIAGTVRGSLWQSMVDVGAEPRLVDWFCDILHDVVDFPDGVGAGDTFQLLVDRLYVDSAFYRFGDIRAVHYRGPGVDAWGFRYRDPGGRQFYCDGEGRSLYRLLDYPPVEGGMRTSDFGMRTHPVRRRRVRHAGQDYAAPYGTPVRSIADGTVVLSRWLGGYGRTVRVRHRDGVLESRYAHLCRYGPGIKPGTPVRQGQVVGYVGSTGVSTGFHLDFGVYRGGEAVDPLEVLPAGHARVAAGDLPAFRQAVEAWRWLISRGAAPDDPGR